jgi:putative acetyltransferase
MREELKQAMKLREDGKLKEANALCLQLVNRYPNDPDVHYQCAWSFDVLGEEAAAVPYYEKAIALGLPDKELAGAYLGLGSTYRTLGNYEKSKETFQKGMSRFPENRALSVFYAMTLHNLHQHEQAMEILLRCIADTTNDAEVLSYQRAIRFYAGQLDRVWRVRMQVDDLSDERVQALIMNHLESMALHSPPESRHALHFDGLRQPDVTFWSAWEGEELVGCGALKELGAAHGEIKSMKTDPRHVRKGVARQVLAHIIDVAKERGYTRLSLETGSMAAFAPARRLYESFGFTYCEPFAHYKHDPNSMFMTKEL